MQDQHPMQDQNFLSHLPESQPESTQQPVQAQQSLHRLPIGMLAGLAAVILVAGSGTALWTWNAHKAPSTIAPAPAPAAPANPPANPAAQLPTITEPAPTTPAQPVEQTVEIYWPITVNEANQPEQVLTAALEKLLAGTTEADVASTIPQGTALNSVSIESDGVYIDLSAEFKSGGGSASMTGRLAQILYTATTLQPDAKVWISVAGEPLEVLGGEGLEIDQPMTRQAFAENFDL
jgi:spore germination protein GerM